MLCADGEDFNNAVIMFTLLAGEEDYNLQLSDIVIDDEVNEAREQLILVLNITSGPEIELDEHGGVLVLSILDDDREIL